MRQVFAVDGGRNCLVECRNDERKRDRDRASSRNATMRWEDEEDDELGWDEEDEAEFQSFQKSLSSRSVCWTANGMTIRARNSDAMVYPERNGKESAYGDGYGKYAPWELGKFNSYDLWDSEEEPSPRFYDEFEDEYRSARRRLRPRGGDLDGRPSPPRSLGRISASSRRSYSHRESRNFSPRTEEYLLTKDRRNRDPHDPYYTERRDHGSSGRESERYSHSIDKERVRSEECDDLPPGFGRTSDRRRSPSPRKHESENGRDPRTCYNCGKVGHLSAQCPMKAERGERSPKRLKTSEEHDRKRRRGKQCYNCGEDGHKSRACPKKVSVSITSKDHNERRGDEKRCHNCHESGHVLFECPMLSDEGDVITRDRDNADRSCIMYKTKLTDAEKNQYLRQNRCFTCGKSGHPYYSCPQSEKRLEYVFEDREYKSALKLLRSACWNYWDENGEMHGPVSLSFMSLRLQEGTMSKDIQVRHMYESIKRISLEKLLTFSKSSMIVSILGCMPESASFLGEEMDAETCKEKTLAALQTKLHYDIYETTVRWLFISSMNEALQIYKTARKNWGKARSQTAEDSDGSGPPHSSDCELSSPDGVPKDGEGLPQKSAMLVECCEKYVTGSNVEDPESKALAAIQKCIHSGVIEAARGGIVDTIIGEHLHTWISNQKELANQKKQEIEVIETTTMVMGNWTNNENEKLTETVEGTESRTKKRKDKASEVDVTESSPATELSLHAWRISKLKENANRKVPMKEVFDITPSPHKKLEGEGSRKEQETEEVMDIDSPVLEVISEDNKHENSEDSKATAESPSVKPVSPPPLNRVSSPPLTRLKKNDSRKKALDDICVPSSVPVPSAPARKKASEDSVPSPVPSAPARKKASEDSVPSPVPSVPARKKASEDSVRSPVPSAPARKKASEDSVPSPVPSGRNKVSEDCVPSLAPARKKAIEDFVPPAPVPARKKALEDCVPSAPSAPLLPSAVEEKKTVDEPPQLVLKVFRKTKKSSATEDGAPVKPTPMTVDKSAGVPAKKRTLKHLAQLADAKV